jgi:hypothetical protein
MAIDLHSRLFKDFMRGRFVVIYSENAVVVLVGFSRFIVIISSVRDLTHTPGRWVVTLPRNRIFKIQRNQISPSSVSFLLLRPLFSS